MTIFLIFAVCCLIMSVLLADSCLAVEWTRAGINTEEPRWGIKGELEIGLWSQGDRQGPRGLIRLYYPIGAAEGGSTRVNFIAVEPVVKGRKGYSELEESAHDGKPGKRFWALDELLTADSPPLDALGLKPGVLSTSASGVEQLAITIRVEPFRNGATRISSRRSVQIDPTKCLSLSTARTTAPTWNTASSPPPWETSRDCAGYG